MWRKLEYLEETMATCPTWWPHYRFICQRQGIKPSCERRAQDSWTILNIHVYQMHVCHSVEKHLFTSSRSILSLAMFLSIRFLVKYCSRPKKQLTPSPQIFGNHKCTSFNIEHHYHSNVVSCISWFLYKLYVILLLLFRILEHSYLFYNYM